MILSRKGGFWGIYKHQECRGFLALGGNNDLAAHVFERTEHGYGGYSICECGRKRVTSCKCAECEAAHYRLVDATIEERLEHELMRLHSRMDEAAPPSAEDTKAEELLA